MRHFKSWYLLKYCLIIFYVGGLFLKRFSLVFKIKFKNLAAPTCGHAIPDLQPPQLSRVQERAGSEPWTYLLPGTLRIWRYRWLNTFLWEQRYTARESEKTGRLPYTTSPLHDDSAWRKLKNTGSPWGAQGLNPTRGTPAFKTCPWKTSPQNTEICKPTGLWSGDPQGQYNELGNRCQGPGGRTYRRPGLSSEAAGLGDAEVTGTRRLLCWP